MRRVRRYAVLFGAALVLVSGMAAPASGSHPSRFDDSYEEVDCSNSPFARPYPEPTSVRECSSSGGSDVNGGVLTSQMASRSRYLDSGGSRRDQALTKYTPWVPAGHTIRATVRVSVNEASASIDTTTDRVSAWTEVALGYNAVAPAPYGSGATASQYVAYAPANQYTSVAPAGSEFELELEIGGTCVTSLFELVVNLRQYHSYTPPLDEPDVNGSHAYSDATVTVTHVKFGRPQPDPTLNCA